MKKLLLILLLSLAFLPMAFCQLCTGSLGDPMVNITFGNAGGPLKPGVTNMTFVFNNCPNDGQYTIAHSAFGCFNSTWYDITNDHTGDNNGQMMLINASLTPDDFYVDTVKGLCGNTTFEFAAWVTNILRAATCGGGVRPNLTFRIETTGGSLLATYSTGSINPASSIQWRQYGTFFTTPAGVTSVVLRITNNSVGGCGNDLAIDDITFRPCGPLLSTLLRAQQTDSVSLCVNETVPLTMDVSATSGLAGYTVQWQVSTDSGKVWSDIAGAMASNYTQQSVTTGFFEYRTVAAQSGNFANSQCRVASSVTSITVHPLPAHLNKIMMKGCTGSAFTLTGVGGTNYTYQWSGPNAFSSTLQSPVVPNAVYSDSGLYKVAVQTVFSCLDNDSVNVTMLTGVKALVSTSAVICQGFSTVLTASGGVSYLWTPVDGLSDASSASPLAFPAITTTYHVVADASNGCTDSANTTVTVYPVPQVSAGPDKQIFEGETTSLDGNITGSYNSFYWLPITAMTGYNGLSPTVSPLDTITYSLNAVPSTACPVVSDYVFVRVYKRPTIPNAFSPNGDGINDTWRIKGLDSYPDAVVTIFDRKGIALYSAGSNNFQWDGTYNQKAVPVDTYYYVIDLHIPRTGLLSGWVVVLR